MSYEPLFELTVASHFFRLNRLSPRMERIAMEFAQRFVLYGIVRQPMGRYSREAKTVYAASNAGRTEFRFHINCFQDFKKYLQERFITPNLYTESVLPIPEASPLNLKMQDTHKVTETGAWVLREMQPAVIEYLLKPPPPRAKFVGIQTGKGKASVLDAKIKVPGGWSTMGEMQVGSQVIAKDGTTTRVTEIHPQGEVDIYQVSFADGRSTKVCGDHLWKVYYVNTEPHKRWRIVNTLEVMRLIAMPNPRVYIDLCDSEQCADLDLPMDPYMLGLLLGNGGYTGGGITYTTQDPSTVKYILTQLPPWMTIRSKGTPYDYTIPCVVPGERNVVIDALRAMNLFGKGSHEKSIPEIYFRASTEQRLALLRGLLDTDGTVQKSGSVSYCSTSEELAKGVQYLVRSLGGIAAIRPRQPFFTYKGERRDGRLAYEVDIRYKRASELFWVERKQCRTNDYNQYADTLKLRVSKVELVGKEQAQCITIDHPEHLYVTDDFIVTHNSLTGTWAITELNMRVLACMKPMFVEKWVDDFIKYTDIKKKEIMVISGSAALMSLLQLAKDGKIDHLKVIVISNKTLGPWIKEYEKIGGRALLEQGYACLPEDLCKHLKVGVRLVDEAHMDLHLNMKIDVYTNVAHSFSLSATMLHGDAFIKKMQDLMYPPAERFDGGELDRYIEAVAYLYHIKPNRRFQVTEFNSPTYSHIAFERSIMKDRDFMLSYFSLIKTIIDQNFIRVKKPGEKFRIFVSSIAMATALTNYLAEAFKDLNVQRYVEDDEYTNLLDADLGVTTVLSGGTGHDIAGLLGLLLTIALDSIQSNIQVMGRLRKLSQSQVVFFYLSCMDVAKQMQFHERKVPMLKERAKSLKVVLAQESV